MVHLAYHKKLHINSIGSYNGIYINVPYNLEDVEFDEVVKENKINDALYNGSSININNVAIVNNGIETNFSEVETARNGQNMVYTNTKQKQNGIQQIKVYSPSTDTTKTFKILNCDTIQKTHPPILYFLMQRKV